LAVGVWIGAGGRFVWAGYLQILWRKPALDFHRLLIENSLRVDNRVVFLVLFRIWSARNFSIVSGRGEFWALLMRGLRVGRGRGANRTILGSCMCSAAFLIYAGVHRCLDEAGAHPETPGWCSIGTHLRLAKTFPVSDSLYREQGQCLATPLFC